MYFVSVQVVRWLLPFIAVPPSGKALMRQFKTAMGRRDYLKGVGSVVRPQYTMPRGDDAPSRAGSSQRSSLLSRGSAAAGPASRRSLGAAPETRADSLRGGSAGGARAASAGERPGTARAPDLLVVEDAAAEGGAHGWVQGAAFGRVRGAESSRGSTPAASARGGAGAGPRARAALLPVGGAEDEVQALPGGAGASTTLQTTTLQTADEAMRRRLAEIYAQRPARRRLARFDAMAAVGVGGSSLAAGGAVRVAAPEQGTRGEGGGGMVPGSVESPEHAARGGAVHVQGGHFGFSLGRGRAGDGAVARGAEPGNADAGAGEAAGAGSENPQSGGGADAPELRPKNPRGDAQLDPPPRDAGAAAGGARPASARVRTPDRAKADRPVGGAPPPHPLRTNRTRRVLHPVLIGHAASLTPC